MLDKRWLPTVLAVGLGVLALSNDVQAATLTPSPVTVIAGNTFTITLDDTIALNDAIGAVTLALNFDPSLLNLQSVTNGVILSEPGSEFVALLFNGTSSGASVSLQEDPNALNDPSGTGSILSFSFLAFAADSTSSPAITFQTQNDPMSDAVGVDGEYQLAPITDIINITAAVTTPPTTVPEPATLALLLAPILAVASLKRRSRC